MAMQSTFEPSDDLVYHYTDASALISILKSTEMRFSDIECLNDALDGSYLMHLYKVVAEVIRSDLGDDDGGHASAFLDSVVRNARMPSRGSQFVCCFSRRFDELNQWVTYSGAMPCCIAFDRHELERVVKKIQGHGSTVSFWAGNVEYDGEKIIHDQMSKKLTLTC